MAYNQDLCQDHWNYPGHLRCCEIRTITHAQVFFLMNLICSFKFINTTIYHLSAPNVVRLYLFKKNPWEGQLPHRPSSLKRLECNIRCLEASLTHHFLSANHNPEDLRRLAIESIKTSMHTDMLKITSERKLLDLQTEYNYSQWSSNIDFFSCF